MDLRLGDIMAKKEFRPLFGVKADTWTKVDAVSTIMFTGVIGRRAIQMFGEHGLFGIGKNKPMQYANFGLSNGAWNYIDTISTVLWAFTLIHGAIDTYEEVNKIPDDKQLMPGRGLVYKGYNEIRNVF